MRWPTRPRWKSRGPAPRIDRRVRVLHHRATWMTGQEPRRHDRGMDLTASLAWLLDEAGAAPGPDRFLAELGVRLLADGLPLAGGALTLAVPHPIIARRTWLWRAETGAVIEALGFAGGPPNQAGRDWLAGLGPVQEDAIGPSLNSPRQDSPRARSAAISTALALESTPR